MKIDKSIFKRHYRATSKYNVEYHLFRERCKSLGTTLTIPKDPKNKKGAVSLKYVCFSGLMATFTADKKRLNRICYKPKVHKTLKAKDVKRWIDIAKSARLLPPYVEFEHLKKTFLLRCNISPSLLYVYLCSLRDLEEEPDFVRISSYFIEQGMDLHAAVVTASTMAINNSGHHYLNLRASYQERPVKSVNVPINVVLQLKKFLRNPSTYDKRSCTFLIGKNYSESMFSAQKIIHGISVPVTANIPILDLFNENVVEMLSSHKKDSIKKYYDKYRKKK